MDILRQLMVENNNTIQLKLAANSSVVFGNFLLCASCQYSVNSYNKYFTTKFAT